MENQLKQLTTFQDVLADYHISKDSQKIMQATTLVAMVAPSSAGRNTIINELIKTGEYHYIVSDTTRKKRVNDGISERDGVEYWFRSEDEVLADLRAGMYLEAAIIHNQQVSGMRIKELERARDEGKVALWDIEIIGMQNAIVAKPDIFALFVLPPSFEIWMERMDGRGTMSLEEKRRRLGSAVLEFTAAIDNDYYTYVINDDFKNSVKKIHNIVLENKSSPDQRNGRELAKKLRTLTEQWLYKT